MMKWLKNRHAPKRKYPVKTTVDLFYQEKPPITIPQLLLAVLVFGVLLVVFGKFAVVDRLAASGAALREAERLEAQLAAIQESNSDYEDVLREYRHYYFSAADGDTAQSYVNCQNVLALLDTEFVNKAAIRIVNLSGNVLTVNMTGINLEEASAIAESLEKNKLVNEVLVSAANKEEQAEVSTVFMTVVLKTEEESEAEEAAAAEQAAGAGETGEQAADTEQSAGAGEAE